MRYSEFMLRIEKQGLKPVDLGDYIEIRNNNDDILFCVGKKSVYVIDLDYDTFRGQCAYFKKILFNLATELASTPLDEREDEKEYYVKFMKGAYLAYYPKSGNYGVVSTREGAQGKTQFTEQEIKNYDSRYWAFAEEVKEDE